MSNLPTDPRMTAQTATVAPNIKDTKTGYVILQQDVGTDHWLFVGSVNSNSGDAAIRHFLEGKSAAATGGQFVALPRRSWQPRKVSLEQVSRVKLEGA